MVVYPFLKISLRLELLKGLGRFRYLVPYHVALKGKRVCQGTKHRRQVRLRDLAWASGEQEVPPDALHVVHE